MKNIKLSVITIISSSLFCYAGGDIYPVTTTPYEQEDIDLAQEAVVEPPVTIETITEPVVEPVIEQPVVEPIVIKPIVKKEKPKEINPSGFYVGLGITGNRYDSNCNCPTKSGTENSVGVVGR
ncbi:MAG: hypothetical protein KAU90_07680, partial [Sulfurovaceae bacterium]|nr:hypothetical protein [Sulfurovaceae bacterium]